MNDEDWLDYERFGLGGSRAIWSDIDQARYWRRMIAESKTRLETLCNEQPRNEGRIQEEAEIMALASRQLAEMESRLFMA